MRISIPDLLVTGSFVFLSSCTTNTIVVVPAPQGQQEARMQASRIAHQPCLLSFEEQKKYASAVPVLTAPGAIPQIAKDARADGCAGVAFQLDASGNAVNLQAIKEYPRGFGFADSLLQTLQQDRFRPSLNIDQWYYVSSAFVTSTMIGPPKQAN